VTAALLNVTRGGVGFADAAAKPELARATIKTEPELATAPKE
jgi:hypothetical protein